MSTEKRVFQILDEMNQADMASGTGTVGICNQQVSAVKTKQGGLITMGVPPEIFHEIVFNSTKQIVLLVIDKAAYEKTKADTHGNSSHRTNTTTGSTSTS